MGFIVPQMYIKKPKGFNFKNTVYSHGWCGLKPFTLDDENWRLSYVFSGKGYKTPIYATISETEKNVKIEIAGLKVGKKTQERMLNDVRHILRVDEDLSEFYGLIKTEKEYSWISKTGTGRIMRSPSVYEDLVKTICTTNCSWALTEIMVTNLVEKLGVQTKDRKRAFPTAQAMAEVDEAFYRNEIRSGYRSPYFLELAEKVAGGELDPEEWRDSDIPSDELKKQIKKVKGVGDYAAENLLKLIGRYDGLALDSWLRSEFYKRHNDGKPCPDKKIERFYKRFGEWKGLIIWLDMTKRFLD